MQFITITFCITLSLMKTYMPCCSYQDDFIKSLTTRGSNNVALPNFFLMKVGRGLSRKDNESAKTETDRVTSHINNNDYNN